MRKRDIVAGIFIGAVLGTLLLLLGLRADGVKAQTAGDCIQVLLNGEVQFEYGVCGGVSTPTATPTDIPTELPPTVTPAPTSTSVPSSDLCEHDDRAFHGLEGDGCHFNHFHGDDPHEVDHIFGTEYYNLAGGEISYPWQTFSAMGLENDVKHGGYFWMVRTGLECFSQFGDGCITDFRAQSHFLMNDHGARTRYHSFSLEARICVEANPTDCGIIRTMGWQDSGTLFVDDVEVLTVTDILTRSPRPVKLHYSGDQARFATWYPVSAWARVAVETRDAWGAVQPYGPLYFGGNHNQSSLQPHVIGVTIPGRQYNSDGELVSTSAILDPDSNGYADWEGWADRYGRIHANQDICSAVSLDCVPLAFENVRLGLQYQYRGDYREYDNGEGWIEYLGP